MLVSKAGGSSKPRHHRAGDPAAQAGRLRHRSTAAKVCFGLFALIVVAGGGLPGAANTATTETTATTVAETSTTAAETTTTVAETTTSTAAPTSTTAADTSTTAAQTTTSTTASSTSTTAGTGTTAVDEADRDRVDAAESSKAREIDAANARLDELNDALGDLEGDIDAQSAAVEIANRRLGEARAVAEATQDEVRDLEQQVRDLQVSLGDQAIRSFKGESVDEAVLVGTDPGRAMRMATLLAKATQSDIDYANLLSSVREDLLASRREAEAAIREADRSRAEGEEQLAELEDDRLAYGDLAASAETRIDHLLSERAALAQLGAEVDAGLDVVDINDELVRRLAAAPAPSSSGGSAPIPVSDGEIVSAGNGIMVHESIVDDVRQLLADAAADGVVLAGGGYRDPAQQIAVRRNNCGTSNYAIYEMPSSQCRPPTARPGRSMHEQGRAIDFTYNGRIISSRSGAAWNWLFANAERYGLYNLPSEPWHWSTNGR
ncbi:MAG: D-alanyl-D-alanine carboxypeptidase family protein [Actinomycetota bacterium]